MENSYNVYTGSPKKWYIRQSDILEEYTDEVKGMAKWQAQAGKKYREGKNANKGKALALSSLRVSVAKT